jgi:hypothetical protein
MFQRVRKVLVERRLFAASSSTGKLSNSADKSSLLAPPQMSIR